MPKQRINMDMDAELWHEVRIAAAMLGVTVRQFVTVSLVRGLLGQELDARKEIESELKIYESERTRRKEKIRK